MNMHFNHKVYMSWRKTEKQHIAELMPAEHNGRGIYEAPSEIGVNCTLDWLAFEGVFNRETEYGDELCAQESQVILSDNENEFYIYRVWFLARFVCFVFELFLGQWGKSHPQTKPCAYFRRFVHEYYYIFFYFFLDKWCDMNVVVTTSVATSGRRKFDKILIDHFPNIHTQAQQLLPYIICKLF